MDAFKGSYTRTSADNYEEMLKVSLTSNKILVLFCSFSLKEFKDFFEATFESPDLMWRPFAGVGRQLPPEESCHSVHPSDGRKIIWNQICFNWYIWNIVLLQNWIDIDLRFKTATVSTPRDGRETIWNIVSLQYDQNRYLNIQGTSVGFHFFLGWFRIRISSPKHLDTLIIPIKNIKCPKWYWYNSWGMSYKFSLRWTYNSDLWILNFHQR